MKKVSKAISVLLVLALIAAFAAVPGSALATELTAGSSKETAANIPQYGVEYVSSLSEAKEVDWFKFTTLSEDAYYEIRLVNYSLNSGSNGTWAPNIYLYDTCMQELESGYNDVVINLKLEKNTTYYLKIYMGRNATDSTGNYEISVSYRLDAVSNEKENALSVNINQSNINSFDGKGDIDWFKFTTSKSGQYIINLKSYDLPTGWNVTWSPNIYLYDTYLQELGTDFNYYDDDAVINAELEANQTYYLKLHMGNNASEATGNYEFTVSFDNSDTPVTPPVTTKSLSSIVVDQLPAKTQYIVGEELDTTGLIVRAKYSDDTSAIITNYEVYGFDSSKAGSSVVRVSYSEGSVTKTTAFSVVINEAAAQEPSAGDSSVLDSIAAFFNSILEFFAMIIKAIIDIFTSIA